LQELLGEFKEGKLVGPGQIKRSNGDVISGVFVNGILNGEGKE
jgi:hypothetical protein